MRATSLLVLLALAASGASAQADPFPVTFLAGGAGDDGCYAQWSTRSAVEAYSAPTTASTPLRTVDAERRIDANDYSESLTAVLQSGRVRARQAVAFGAVRLGTGEPETVRLAAGEELEVLAPGPEGSAVFSYAGGVYSGAVPDAPATVTLRQPAVEVWVRLREHDGRPASWLNTAQAGMAPRERFCE